VDRDGIRPILGRKPCVGINIVVYLDNDDINKPSGNAQVYGVDNSDNQ